MTRWGDLEGGEPRVSKVRDNSQAHRGFCSFLTPPMCKVCKHSHASWEWSPGGRGVGGGIGWRPSIWAPVLAAAGPQGQREPGAHTPPPPEDLQTMERGVQTAAQPPVNLEGRLPALICVQKAQRHLRAPTDLWGQRQRRTARDTRLTQTYPQGGKSRGPQTTHRRGLAGCRTGKLRPADSAVHPPGHQTFPPKI